VTLLVNIKHARKLRYCSPGLRRGCARYGLDFLKFVREGLPEEELLATGDCQVAKIVEVAREEQRAKDRERGS
jgi:hypothetical protein